MANQTNSLADTKEMCQYLIVFASQYSRKAIYNPYRADRGGKSGKANAFRRWPVLKGF